MALPYRLHRDDPGWAPPLRRDVRILLDRRANPFFEHAEVEYFLARAGTEVVGRIAAVHNRAHNAYHGDKVGFFGLFDCVEDDGVAKALFEAAASWLRARGLEVMRGPAHLSTNDECGLLVEGFETPAALMMPHNPPYYVTLVEGAGFTKARDLLVYQTTHDRLPDRLVRGTKVLEERYGIRTRSLALERFDAELAAIKRLYNAAWERNWDSCP